MSARAEIFFSYAANAGDEEADENGGVDSGPSWWLAAETVGWSRGGGRGSAWLSSLPSWPGDRPPGEQANAVSGDSELRLLLLLLLDVLLRLLDMVVAVVRERLCGAPRRISPGLSAAKTAAATWGWLGLTFRDGTRPSSAVLKSRRPGRSGESAAVESCRAWDG
jgi:hypothetical protein